MNHFKRKLQLLGWHTYYDGWTFTVFRSVVKASEILKLRGTRSSWFQEMAERQFDNRFKVKTRGIVSTKQLGYSAEQRIHAVEYLPTRASSIAWLLSVLPIDYERFSFVDFGSGKGRVLLVAGQFPFRSVAGVELSTELHQIASRNILSSKILCRKCSSLSSHNANACDFEIPESPLVAFLYNPFSQVVLKTVLENLHAATTQQSRPLIVIYHNPVYSKEIEEGDKLRDAFHACLPGHGWNIYANEHAISTPSESSF